MMRTDEPFPRLAESQGDQVATMRCGDSEGQRPRRRTGRPTVGTSALAATGGGMDDLFSDTSPCHTHSDSQPCGQEVHPGSGGAVAAVNTSDGASALLGPAPLQRENDSVGESPRLGPSTPPSGPVPTDPGDPTAMPWPGPATSESGARISGTDALPLWAEAADPSPPEFRSVPVDLIQMPGSLPGASAAWPALVRSILELGLLHPLTVEEQSGGGYRLLAGRSRLSAVRSLGWTEVQCRAFPALPSRRAALVPLAENVLRRPMQGEDKSRAYKLFGEAIGSGKLAAAELGVHEKSFSRSLGGRRRHSKDFREGSLQRRAVAVLDEVKQLAPLLNSTELSALAAELRVAMAAVNQAVARLSEARRP